MARKIFVSYKYGDTSVQKLLHTEQTKVRDYVNVLQEVLSEDHIYKGEDDGTDLSMFKDETIESNLRDKIYDSSITIVLISKNMRDPYLPEEDQWMPWEISYSLREKSRGERSSGMNALLAVVLPDEYGSHEYFIKDNSCGNCNARLFQTSELFHIMRRNMFNKKEPNLADCIYHGTNSIPHMGDDHSYIYTVKWEDFLTNMEPHIEKATSIYENSDQYDIGKKIRPSILDLFPVAA